MQRRRWLLSLTLAAFAAQASPLHAQASQPAAQTRARIKLDPERVIAEVHPHVFGNFVEHLGRCVYGGVFEEGSPLSDENGFRKDVMDATLGLGVTLLRWPGGNFASGYNWKDGIGPRDQRPARRDNAWGALESNRFGTDEFLSYCEKLKVDPYVCINAGLGSVDDARNWVEYTNESASTYWANQRRKNGRDKPWNVKIWGLGNEIDGPWQLGHKNAEDYAKFALEAAKAMRRADEKIQLIASGSSNFGAGSDWVGWNRTVLERLRNEIDYISLHTYVGNRTNDFEQFLAFGRDLDDRIEVVKGQIRAVRVGNTAARPIHIAFDEWNVWYRTITPGMTEYEIGKLQLEEFYNYEDALAMAVFLNSFIRHADVVKMANLAQLVNVIAPMFTNPQGMYFQTTYFPIAEYAKQRGFKALDVLVDSPQYRPDKGRELGYLDVSATYDPKTKRTYLNVLNRSSKSDIVTRVDSAAGAPSGTVDVWELNHPDLKATHTFGKDKVVRPATRKAAVKASGGGFDYTFPKQSLTILSW
jgi:alpha-N-arabinofuranosidase